MPKLVFSNHVLSVFNDAGTEYDQVKNLMYDLAMGNEIYDEETGKVISKRDAEKALLDISQKIFGINSKSTRRERKRAYEDHAKEYFRVIEETVDDIVTTGSTLSECASVLMQAGARQVSAATVACSGEKKEPLR